MRRKHYCDAFVVLKEELLLLFERFCLRKGVARNR